MGKIIRAISIRQPFEEQILRGDKKWEYRSLDTKIRERVYLSASNKPGPAVVWDKLRMQPGEPTDWNDHRVLNENL
jgi:hypothetical protein